MIQEALNNTAKHSGAEFVEISLVKSNGRMELTIRDNGAGFDLSGARRGKDRERSLGLVGMKERTELSGGYLFLVESNIGAGTTIRASWPFEQE